MPVWQPRNTARARELRNAATPAERKLWQYLGASQLDGNKFSRQIPVGPYYGDFLCRAKRLILEIDGYSHEVDTARDAKRDEYLSSLRYMVMRFSNADVMSNVEGVVTAIGIALADRPTPVPVSGERCPASFRSCWENDRPETRKREGGKR